MNFNTFAQIRPARVVSVGQDETAAPLYTIQFTRGYGEDENGLPSYVTASDSNVEGRQFIPDGHPLLRNITPMPVYLVGDVVAVWSLETLANPDAVPDDNTRITRYFVLGVYPEWTTEPGQFVDPPTT